MYMKSNLRKNIMMSALIRNKFLHNLKIRLRFSSFFLILYSVLFIVFQTHNLLTWPKNTTSYHYLDIKLVAFFVQSMFSTIQWEIDVSQIAHIAPSIQISSSSTRNSQGNGYVCCCGLLLACSMWIVAINVRGWYSLCFIAGLDIDSLLWIKVRQQIKNNLKCNLN